MFQGVEKKIIYKKKKQIMKVKKKRIMKKKILI